MTTPKPSKTLLDEFSKADYKRLKDLELKGIDNYREMRQATPLTLEAVVSFINQLSIWNLKTTGIYVLETFVDQECQRAANVAIISELEELLNKKEITGVGPTMIRTWHVMNRINSLTATQKAEKHD